MKIVLINGNFILMKWIMFVTEKVGSYLNILLGFLADCQLVQ